jgi:hypothetical protein
VCGRALVYALGRRVRVRAGVLPEGGIGPRRRVADVDARRRARRDQLVGVQQRRGLHHENVLARSGEGDEASKSDEAREEPTDM